MFFNKIIVLLSIIRLACATYCEVHIGNATNLPMIIERFGYYHRFVVVDNNDDIQIRSGKSVTATCQNGLLSFRDKILPKTKAISIFCREEYGNCVPYLHVDGRLIPYDPFVIQLTCDKRIIQMYEYNVIGCDYTGIAAGYINTMHNKTEFINLIQYCYDEVEMRTVFAQHIVTKRSSFVEDQVNYNNEFLLYDDKAQIPTKTIDFFSGNIDHCFRNFHIKKHISSLFGDRYNDFNLAKVNLIISQTLPKPFLQATETYLNSALQWTGLRDGNWKRLQHDINDIANYDMAQIFSGTSGIIALENASGKMQNLYICSQQMFEPSIPVPFYYWTYVRTQSSTKDQSNSTETLNNSWLRNGVVIVGINTPYLKSPDIKIHIFCKDVCDQVPWLYKLKSTRKMHSLGYVFCCQLNEAMDNLPEIPEHLGLID